MDKVKIGVIVKPVGLSGEVKVYNFSDSKERFKELEGVFAGDLWRTIEKARFLKENVILKLSGIDGIDEAEKARGTELFIDAALLPELPEGEFYIRDIIGFSVFEESGVLLGRLTDVIQGSAQDLFEVEVGEKKALIPAVEEFIKDIDTGNKKITVKLIEGLI